MRNESISREEQFSQAGALKSGKTAIRERAFGQLPKIAGVVSRPQTVLIPVQKYDRKDALRT